VLIKKLIVWGLIVTVIFALHDNPPRKTQAEINKKGTNEIVQVTKTPVEKPKVVEQKPAEQVTPQPKQVEAPKPKPVVQGVTNCGDNVYKQYIYQKESSCRLDNVNSGGCYGLGQDCNNVLANACPNWRTDFACQDAFWEDYMKRRYGTWEKAYYHWLARVPINGRDVGNWW
jgi:hypothetical protein